MRSRYRGLLARLAGACAALAWILAPAAPGAASVTDPTLILTGGLLEPGNPAAVLALEGTMPYDELLPQPLPIHVLAWDASGNYVRFALGGGVFVGQAPELVDGLSPAEAATLASQGSASPDGSLLLFSEHRFDFLLPAQLTSGSLTVQVFAIEDDGGVVLSNALSVSAS